MEGMLTKFLAGELFKDPLVGKLFLLFIFVVGSAQVVRWIHEWWKTGKLKTKAQVQEKQVSEEKGQWKKVVEELVKETKARNERADRIYEKIGKILDSVLWLVNVHDKVDEEGRYVWYARKSLEIAIEKLARSVDKQTAVMDRMWGEIKDTGHKVERLDDKIAGSL